MDSINLKSAILNKMTVFKKTKWRVGTFPEKITIMKKMCSGLAPASN